MKQSDHKRIEDRSLALHSAIAVLLRRDPSIRKVALKNIERWNKRGEGQPDFYLSEWKEKLLKSTKQELVDFLKEDSEMATTMRQSSPFTGILPESRRQKIFARFARHEED